MPDFTLHSLTHPGRIRNVRPTHRTHYTILRLQLQVTPEMKSRHSHRLCSTYLRFPMQTFRYQIQVKFINNQWKFRATKTGNEIGPILAAFSVKRWPFRRVPHLNLIRNGKTCRAKHVNQRRRHMNMHAIELEFLSIITVVIAIEYQSKWNRFELFPHGFQFNSLIAVRVIRSIPLGQST